MRLDADDVIRTPGSLDRINDKWMKTLDDWVENQERSLSTSEYYDLLLRYEKYRGEQWRK